MGKNTKRPTDLTTTPLWFSEKVLGLPLYDWQAKAVMSLEDMSGRVKTCVVSPNGAGKSERVVAPSALYVAMAYPQGRVAITTKDNRQLNEQIVPAIEAHIHKFEGWKSVRSPYYKVITPTGSSIIAFTTDDAGRVEGMHQRLPDSPLLWVVDEGKSVEEEIYQGVDRCGYTWLIVTSSPGLMMGRFFDMATKHRGDGHNGTVKVLQAGLIDCPHIPKSKIDDVIKTYGEKHPYTRSTIYGEFMEQDEANRYIISFSSLERAIANPPPYRSGPRILFCDFAGGGDENCIAMREGNKISLEAHWREKDKGAAVYRFIQEFRRLGVKAESIYGDAAQKDMCDMLSSSGWAIRRKNFGDRNCLDQYRSWGAQAWLELGLAIEKGELILPNDDQLKAQLTSRQKKFFDSGKLGIEEKWFMTQRNLPSPDRGDAVAGVNAVYGPQIQQKQPFSIPSGYFTSGRYSEETEAGDYATVLEGIGANAGL